MFKNSREDIYGEKLNYMMLSLFSKKINVLIIGGGNAALIKCKTFIKNGCNVFLLGKEIKDEFYNIEGSLNIIKEEYNEKFLKGKHIVVIAIDDKDIINSIVEKCNELDKIYINCKKSREGLGVLPMNIHSEEIILGINTLRGNPKGLRMISEDFLDKGKELDKFIKITSIIRNNLKILKDNKYKKEEILNFIISNDYKYFIDKDKHKVILKLFYDENIVDNLLRD